MFHSFSAFSLCFPFYCAWWRQTALSLCSVFCSESLILNTLQFSWFNVTDFSLQCMGTSTQQAYGDAETTHL